MKKIVHKLFLLLLLHAALFFPSSHYFDSYFSAHLNMSEKANWIFSQTDQHLDFAVIGASRTLNVIDVREIEKITDFKGINLAAAGNGYADNYLVYTNYLKNGN